MCVCARAIRFHCFFFEHKTGETKRAITKQIVLAMMSGHFYIDFLCLYAQTSFVDTIKWPRYFIHLAIRSAALRGREKL